MDFVTAHQRHFGPRAARIFASSHDSRCLNAITGQPNNITEGLGSGRVKSLRSLHRREHGRQRFRMEMTRARSAYAPFLE